MLKTQKINDFEGLYPSYPPIYWLATGWDWLATGWDWLGLAGTGWDWLGLVGLAESIIF